MRKRIMWSTCLALAVAVIGVAVYAAGQEGEKNCPGHKAGAGHGMRGMHAALQGATVKVTNTANGVTLTITSDNPEQVKTIQERFANFGKGQCGHAEGSEACKKAHESGKCRGHEPGSEGHAE